MKVRNKVVPALFLAAQVNLVSANENVFSMEPVNTGIGGDKHFVNFKEAKISTPMSFNDVVVVAPDLNAISIANQPKSKGPNNDDDMSVSPNIAYKD